MARFKQATALTVATTGLLLLATGDVGAEPQGVEAEPSAVDADEVAREATEQALLTFGDLWTGFVELLPKLLVVVLVLAVAWGLSRSLRPLLRRLLGRWERGAAASALVGVLLWLFAAGVALSVLAGDIRALVGSLGLVGLALSWSLQSPIESFTGWLFNSFKGYYRIGDRIAVGEVVGDVVDMDFLTTTVWEIGGPDRPSSGISAEQPTGRVITFPNSEVLSNSIVNYTADFAYVWDELAVSVAAESDLRRAATLAEAVARELLGAPMREPAARYAEILRAAGLPADIPLDPVVYFSMTISGVDLTIRYLVPARERRKWKSELVRRVVEAFARPEHASTILPVYPRHQVQFVGPDGRARWGAADQPPASIDASS